MVVADKLSRVDELQMPFDFWALAILQASDPELLQTVEGDTSLRLEKVTISGSRTLL